MHELSLVFFTVLAQCAVGIFLVLGCLQFASFGQRDRLQLLSRLQIASLVILGVAGLAAGTHLGQPLRAFNVIFGLEHLSPLSVEILTTSLFGGAAFTFIAATLLNILPALHRLVLLGAMALGVALLLAIANVYTLATVPTWNTDWTVFQFVMPAVVLGVMGAAVLVRSQSDRMGLFARHADKALSTIGLIALAVIATGFVLYLFWLGQLSTAIDPFMVKDYHHSLLAARFALLFLGVSLWIVPAMRGSNTCVRLPAVGFVLVLASELMGRIFFYDLHMFSTGL